jgi:hypothetical protein
VARRLADLHDQHDVGRLDAADHAVVADAEAAGASEAVAQRLAELERVVGELAFDRAADEPTSTLWLRERDGMVSARMLTLFGNAFSPFSRKVQLVLEYKGIDYEMVDGLSRANHDRLAEVNQRLEVPAINHDGLIVVNSADIVAYLERVFPDRPLYPRHRHRPDPGRR